MRGFQGPGAGGRGPEKGFTLFEILIAMLLLGMISIMIYSVLNVGIKFSDKGEKQVHSLERESNFLALLHRQINCAWYDTQQKKIIISADDDILKLVTRSPLIWHRAGLVLAVYRYRPDEKAVYYIEKKDFYNIDYNEEYVPDFPDMIKLSGDIEALVMTYDPESGEGVLVEYGDKQYEFMPKSMLSKTFY
ncbi:MAG: prepilin-type N-terminal cleavage/methylation domain-containing protein [Thermodesulfobacteriota bacterium]|nr:prepilin-type N-terminal cleavage/methylation domain-containing protein [Thermodesulfobacteriota bacterium]